MAWLNDPSTRPTNLGRLPLKGMAGRPNEGAPGMALDLHTLDEHLSLPPHLAIERVGGRRKHSKTWLRILFCGSELPEEGLTLLLDMVYGNMALGMISPFSCYSRYAGR